MYTKAIILAGGLGTRLYKYTNGLYPKILINLGNSVFLDKLIEFWFDVQEVSELVIVLSENDHLYKIQEYLKVFHSERKVSLLKYDKVDGTFNTLFYVFNMRGDLAKSNLLISWSDIIPSQKLNVLEEPGIKIFTDEVKRHRCNIDKNGFINQVNDMSGNIPGFYNVNESDILDWINFKIAYSTTHSEIDITDFFKSCNDLQQEEISLTDIGDVQKYEAELSSQNIKQRWFNDISFTNAKVLKSSNNQYGDIVMQSEIAFYNHIKGTEAENIFPKVYETTPNSISMENMYSNGYVTVNEYLEKYPGQETKILSDYYEGMKSLHSVNSKITNFNDDVYAEYIKVAIERYSKISYFIPKVDFLEINGKCYTGFNFYQTMDKLLKYFSNKKFDIALIHGDTNSTNTMYNPETGKIALIDPRGKFGNTMFYGDVNYDIAKFVYGITGYDTFNLDKYFTFDFNTSIDYGFNTMRMNLPPLDLLDQLDVSNDIKILVGLIWLKLPFYIKNNPNKIIASYYIGLSILNKYLYTEKEIN